LFSRPLATHHDRLRLPAVTELRAVTAAELAQAALAASAHQPNDSPGKQSRRRQPP